MHIYNSYKRIVNTCLGVILISYACVAYNHLDSFKKEHFNTIFEGTELIHMAELHPQMYDDFDTLLNLDPTLTIEQQREIYLRHVGFLDKRLMQSTCQKWFKRCVEWTPHPLNNIHNINAYPYQS